MGVSTTLRKTLSLTLALSLVLSSTAFAAGKEKSKPNNTKPAVRDQQLTAYSYAPDAFCKEGAGKMMKDLNEKNADKLEEMNKVQGEIKDLEAQMKLINSMSALKNSYFDSLRNLTSGQKKAEADKFAALDDMKKAVRTGLIISAVGALLKDGNLDTKDTPDMNDLCSAQDKTSQAICSKELKPEATTLMQKMKNAFASPHALNATIANFKSAYANVKDSNKPELKKSIQKIIDSIPENIGPDALFQILETKSPNVAKLLASEKGKSEITTCLNDKSQNAYKACEGILPSLKEDPNIVLKISQETQAVLTHMTTLSTVVDEASKANITQLNDKIKEVEQQKPFDAATAFTGTKDKIQALKDVGTDYNKNNPNAKNRGMDHVAQLFLTNPMSEASESEGIKARQEATFWEQKCMPPSSEDLDKCSELGKKVQVNVDNKKNHYATQLEMLQNKMQEYSTNRTSRFSTVEKLKKYVAEKYLRSCNKSASNLKVKNSAATLSIEMDGKCYSGVNNLKSIEGLGSDLNEVVSQYKFAYDVSAESDTTGAFSKAEMEDYNTTCSHPEFGDDLSDVCSIIRNEKTARNSTRDSKDWEDFNEKYWVKYDASSPKGYSVATKKSNLRVFGEGVLPVVPQMIPMFFQNYATKSNIEMLTSQAMYQKQMLHVYDVYNANPWMYNYNYFGGIQGYGNYGLFGNTGSTTTTTGTSNAGFNFGL